MNAPAIALDASGTIIELVLIEAGETRFGSPLDEAGRSANEVVARRVEISKPFYLGRHPLTQAQYRAVMNALPAQPAGDALPVSQLSYRDALELCRRLSKSSGAHVALPTEAQWELACRAGTETPYWSGADEAALARAGWYRANAERRVHPVGEKAVNAFGLSDVHGNVWEMCADFHADPSRVRSVDPVGLKDGVQGALRGGGWMHGAADCRAARRMLTDEMFGGAGVRIAILL